MQIFSLLFPPVSAFALCHVPFLPCIQPFKNSSSIQWNYYKLLYSGRKILKTSSWGFCVCLFFVGLVGWGFLVLFFKIRISLSFPCSGLIKFRNAPCTDWGFKCIMYYSSGLASFIEGTGGIKKWAKYKSQRPPWVQHLSVNLKTGMLF